MTYVLFIFIEMSGRHIKTSVQPYKFYTGIMPNSVIREANIKMEEEKILYTRVEQLEYHGSRLPDGSLILVVVDGDTKVFGTHTSTVDDIDLLFINDPFPDSSENPNDPLSENIYATNKDIDELFDDDPDTPVITEIADPEDIDEIFADDEDYPPAPPPVITQDEFVNATDIDNMFLDDDEEIVPDATLDPDEYMTKPEVDAMFPETTYSLMSRGDVDVIFMDDEVDLITPKDPADDRLASADLVTEVFEDDDEEIIPDDTLDSSKYTVKEDVDTMFTEEDNQDIETFNIDSTSVDTSLNSINQARYTNNDYVTTSDIDSMF